MFDGAELLNPIEGDSPCGPDLYDLGDADFATFEIACQGKAEQVVGDNVIEAEEPDWKEVRKVCIGLFARNKDLRVAVKLAVASTALDGLVALAACTALIKGLIETFWDHLYPRLDDGSDPWRLNIVQELDDPDSLLRQLRASVFAQARGIGRFTCRDIEVADGALSPAEGAAAPGIAMIIGALRESDPGAAAAVVAACDTIEADLAAIVTVFQDKQGTQPGFAKLTKLLRRYREVAASADSGADGSATSAEGAGQSGSDDFAPGGDGGGSATGGGGRIAGRADAKRTLGQVCDYLERNEPSNPAPLLIRRAIRLLDMSFLDIINDMAPDSMARMRDLGGIPGDTGGSGGSGGSE